MKSETLLNYVLEVNNHLEKEYLELLKCEKARKESGYSNQTIKAIGDNLTSLKELIVFYSIKSAIEK